MQNMNRTIDVPVEVWLPRQYPHVPPIVLVVPRLLPLQNPPVLLRATELCDERGFVYLPTPVSSLVDLIRYLQAEFRVQLPIVTGPVEEVLEWRPVIVSPGSAGPVPMSPGSASPVPTSPGGMGLSPAGPRSESPGNAESASVNRLRQEVRTRLQTLSDEMESVLMENSQLTEGAQILAREQLALSNELTLICKETEMLRRQERETGRLLEKTASASASAGQWLKMLVPDDAQSHQLAELLASEAALNDALCAVIRTIVVPSSMETRLALSAGMRSIRELSRRHFLAKAHIRRLVSGRSAGG